MDDREPRALTWPPPGMPVIPERRFYGGAPRPAREPTFFERVPGRSIAFGAILFGLGWLGILFQRGLVRQLVIGAPIFEELAKLGPVLILIGLLRIRPAWGRLPFAWTSGGAFGVLEHYLTYSDEAPAFMALRIAFHAGTCGLSIVMFTLLEPIPDVRARWASTVLSSILHAANNIGALILSVVAVLADVSLLDTIYSVAIILAAVSLTFAILLTPARASSEAKRFLKRLFPTLTLTTPQATDPPGP